MDDEIAHVVQAGDTLEGLARDYLAAPHQWRALQERNHVANPRHLRPGSVLWIPVRLQAAESAKVAFVHGAATARARGAGAAVAMAPGDTLEEGAHLQVGPDAFVSIHLADGSVVRVQAQSELQLRQLRRRGRAGSVQSVLEMQRGAVESTVPPQAEPRRRMEIRTPQAVTSVRGTQFGVALSGTGQTLATVLQGSVAVQSRQDGGPGFATAATTMLAPGQGVAVAADGAIGAPRPLLAAPTLPEVATPWEDASILALNVSPVSGAVQYVAHLARDADFTQVLRHGSFVDGRVRWQTPDDGRYYLAVRAVDEAGFAGLPMVQPLTIKARPVPPLYLQSAEPAVLAAGVGVLRCTPVPGVRWYRVQVAVDARFSQPLRDEQRLTECALPLAGLPVGRYFWRVASVQELPGASPDQGPFALPQAFTVARPPAVLAAQSMQAQDGDATVQLRWPGEPGQRFRLQVATDAAFAQTVQDTVLDAPTWISGDLAAGVYLVRIQVQDATGLQSDFSPPREIRVGTGLKTGAGLPVSASSGDPVRRP